MAIEYIQDLIKGNSAIIACDEEYIVSWNGRNTFNIWTDLTPLLGFKLLDTRSWGDANPPSFEEAKEFAYELLREIE